MKQQILQRNTKRLGSSRMLMPIFMHRLLHDLKLQAPQMHDSALSFMKRQRFVTLTKRELP